MSWWEHINFQWDVDEVRFVLDQHAELDMYSASSLKQQSADRHVAPLGYVILIHVASGEATNTNCIVFCLTWPGLEPTIYRIRVTPPMRLVVDWWREKGKRLIVFVGLSVFCVSVLYFGIQIDSSLETFGFIAFALHYSIFFLVELTLPLDKVLVNVPRAETDRVAKCVSDWSIVGSFRLIDCRV